MPHLVAHLTDRVRIRPLVQGDAPAMLVAYLRNREHLRPWEPDRSAEFFTLAGQRAYVGHRVAEQEAGRLQGWVLLDGDRIVGTLTLSGLVRGPFRSADLGYWVDAEYTGRGLATAAVDRVCRAAEADLGLHRIQAGVLPVNAASQSVLERSGFTRIGLAPDYLHIAGAWRDHLLYQRILHTRPLR
ncbi:GNAT family N-acetyltransferase [Streptomyces sp. NPDC059740]|uniref:GNAT family N-acetyltransferase n=1 Tax=Streptomyces sp. NPDC059740 TaxID=3346926 RepID=UPI00364BA6C3